MKTLHANDKSSYLTMSHVRIKEGGQLPRAPRLKGAPRDEIYLFQTNTRLKNFVIQKRYKNTTLYYIPMLLYISRGQGPPTATDLSTSLTVCQF